MITSHRFPYGPCPLSREEAICVHPGTHVSQGHARSVITIVVAEIDDVVSDTWPARAPLFLAMAHDFEVVILLVTTSPPALNLDLLLDLHMA